MAHTKTLTREEAELLVIACRAMADRLRVTPDLSPTLRRKASASALQYERLAAKIQGRHRPECEAADVELQLDGPPERLSQHFILHNTNP